MKKHPKTKGVFTSENAMIKITFAENVSRIYNHTINGLKSNRVSDEVFKFIQRNAVELEKIIDYKADLKDYDYAAVMSFTKRGL